MQWNCYGLQGHKPELQNYMANSINKPDVICVEETLLKQNKNFFLQGYEVIRKDRGDEKGGGVATLIRSGLNYTEIPITLNKIETIVVEIHSKNSKITIVNVYDPPDRLVDLEDYRKVFGIGGGSYSYWRLQCTPSPLEI